MKPSHPLRTLTFALVAGLFITQAAPAQTAPTAGLIHQWHFDETSGTTAFDSIGTSDFALLNGAAFTTGGIAGGAVQLDGVNDSLLVTGLETFAPLTNFTLSLWELFAPSTNKLGLLAFTDSYRTAAVDLGFGDPQPVLLENGNTGKIQKSVSLGDGQWHLITLVGSGGVIILYVDQAQSQYVNTPDFNGAMSLQLGQEEISHFFSGKIDEVSLYNRALSPAEIVSAAAVPEPTAIALVAGIVLLAGTRRIPGRVGVSPAGLGVLA